MASVVRFVLESQRTFDVPGAGRFTNGVLDVLAADPVAVDRARFRVPPYGGKEYGTVDSATPPPTLPAVPLPPGPDPYPQYITDAELASALSSIGSGVADGAVTTTKLATNAVTTGKLAAGAVTAAKFGSDVPTVVKTGSYADLTGTPTIPPPTTDAGALTSGTLADGRLPARLGDAALGAAFIAGGVLNSDGSPSATKKLMARLTADGTDIDNLFIATVA